jgi:hypothetical protein
MKASAGIILSCIDNQLTTIDLTQDYIFLLFLGKGKPRAKTPKSNKKHDQILSSQLSAIENTILSPECETDSTDSDSLLDSELPQKESQQMSAPKNNHPQFGGKRPKNHPPPQCINLKCKKE